MNRFMGPRLEPELEKRFRSETLAQDKRQVTVVVVLTLIITIGFVALDLRLLQDDHALRMSLLSRGIAIAVSLVAIWVIQRLSSIKLFEAIVFVWMCVVVCHMLVVHMFRPGDYVAVIVWDLITIYGAYILIPISLRWQTAAALLLSAGGVVLWLIDRFPVAEAYESVAVLAAYTFANVWGLLSSSRMSQSHRRRFVLLTQEKALRQELETALAEVKVLRGIIPICSFCKKIRNDEGYYEALEAYISRYSEAHFSHTLCPDCFKEHYPDVYEDLEAEDRSVQRRQVLVPRS